MEFVLTEEGRKYQAKLHKKFAEAEIPGTGNYQDSWDSLFLDGIDEGIIASGERGFDSWEDFTRRFGGSDTADIIRRLFEAGYITLIGEETL